jgi:xylulokinase
MKYLLGIDIGTSGTKTVVFDFAGNTVAHHTAEYPMETPKPGWAQQKPQDWWEAVCVTVRGVLQKGISPEDIAAVGLSGQMHGLVMLDKSGEVLAPSIIWCDQRTDEECGEITRRVGAKRLIELTANPALTGFTASKILWARKHWPEAYEKCSKILLPKDYIRYKLTGVYATEVSDASGMQLLNVGKRDWSTEVLEKLEIEPSLLAEVFESVVISGKISRQGAAETGLLEGTPVAGGGGDQAAGAVGNGIVRPGLVSSTIGTSGVVFAHTESMAIDPGGRVHTFCHAVPGAWHVMGVTQGAGLSLRWFRDTFCEEEKRQASLKGVDVYEIMTANAQKAPPGGNGVYFLPYLMGERTPHLDPYARGVFFGISAVTTKNDMVRAVMEGITYSLRDCMGIIREMGFSATEVRASGGGARSLFWRQMQADMFGCPVFAVNSPEGPALGAALIAGVGAGVWGSVPEACDAAVQAGGKLLPDLAAADDYRRGYGMYTALYPALKEVFRRAAQGQRA